jgi:hypothetical protein
LEGKQAELNNLTLSHFDQFNRYLPLRLSQNFSDVLHTTQQNKTKQNKTKQNTKQHRRRYKQKIMNFCEIVICHLLQMPLQKADQSPSNYVDVVYAFSTLLAMWSFAIIFDLCKKPLSDVHITPKFFCLQLVLVIVGLQQSIISAFQMAGLIVCDPPLPAQTVAQRKCNDCS